MMHNEDCEGDTTQTYETLLDGAMASQYRVVKRIDAGGTGEVFLAEDSKLNRPVALKFLRSEWCSHRSTRERFTCEARTAAGLDHPNIVTVHEVGEFRRRPFFSMQFIDGADATPMVAFAAYVIRQTENVMKRVPRGELMQPPRLHSGPM